MAYTRVNWQDLPSTTTPRNATNLNKMDAGIKANDDKLLGNTAMGDIVVDSIRSKNMFSSQLELGTYDNSGNKSSSTANYRSADFVAVNPNKTYTFSINGTSQKYVLLYYTSARAFISQDTSLTTGTFTTPNNAYYINIRCFSADYTNDYASLKIQLEEGTTATTYAPYQDLNNTSGCKYSYNLYLTSDQTITGTTFASVNNLDNIQIITTGRPILITLTLSLALSQNYTGSVIVEIDGNRINNRIITAANTDVHTYTGQLIATNISSGVHTLSIKGHADGASYNLIVKGSRTVSLTAIEI